MVIDDGCCESDGRPFGRFRGSVYLTVNNLIIGFILWLSYLVWMIDKYAICIKIL